MQWAFKPVKSSCSGLWAMPWHNSFHSALRCSHLLKTIMPMLSFFLWWAFSLVQSLCYVLRTLEPVSSLCHFTGLHWSVVPSCTISYGVHWSPLGSRSLVYYFVRDCSITICVTHPASLGGGSDDHRRPGRWPIS